MKFNVYGRDIEVKKVPKLIMTKGVAASYCLKTKSIEIDSALKGEDMIHAYIHELIHALCDRIGLINCDFSHDLEELLADNVPAMLLENFEIKCKRRVK